MTIIQGDQVTIAVQLTDEADNIITPDDVDGVVLTLGTVSRRSWDEEYPVEYDQLLRSWLLAVTQEDSFALRAGVAKMSARVVFLDGGIGGANVATVFVLPAQNREVL